MEFKSIFSLNIEDWQNWLVANNQPKFRAKQIFDWLYKKRVLSIDEMSNLPKDLKHLLSETFDFTTLSERKKQIASDGTTKFLFELADGNLIETVLMRHNYGYSVCVTTQVGCRIGCKFCASTLSGLKRNLEAGEIVAQVLRVQQYLDETEGRVSHIVVMGIGEPVENYDNLTRFINIINDDMPDIIFGIRKDSPLIVGIGENENILASDIPAILHITNKYVVLDNYDIVCLTKDNIKYYNREGIEINKEVKEFTDEKEAISKNGYEHFMLKEINEEPEIVKKLLNLYTENGKVKDIFDISKYKNIN